MAECRAARLLAYTLLFDASTEQISVSLYDMLIA